MVIYNRVCLLCLSINSQRVEWRCLNKYLARVLTQPDHRHETTTNRKSVKKRSEYIGYWSNQHVTLQCGEVVGRCRCYVCGRQRGARAIFVICEWEKSARFGERERYKEDMYLFDVADPGAPKPGCQYIQNIFKSARRPSLLSFCRAYEWRENHYKAIQEIKMGAADILQIGTLTLRYNHWSLSEHIICKLLSRTIIIQ